MGGGSSLRVVYVEEVNVFGVKRWRRLGARGDNEAEDTIVRIGGVASRQEKVKA